MLASAYPTSFTSSGCNPILQKFCIMICEIIVYKTVSGIFLIFCRSSFTDNFIMKSIFSEPWNQRNVNISRLIYLETISAHRVKDHICTNKLEEFFFRKNFFSRTWRFFHGCETTDLSLIFFHKKVISYFFSSVII